MGGVTGGGVAEGSGNLPDFDDLPMIEALGLRHAWDVLDRSLGTLSLLSEGSVVEAAHAVRSGVVVPLNLPVNEPDPPLFGREPVSHSVFSIDRNTLDDRLDAFHPQASSQWDGLRHVRCREYGYFGGEDEDSGAETLGIEHWAERGIVGRGVLLDVAKRRERTGGALDPFSGEAIPADELRRVAEAQEVEVLGGDILCVRTGWIEAFGALGRDRREKISEEPRFAGLLADEEMARFLWNSHVAALACDNPAVEAAPGDPAVGSLHRRVIPLLGLALAELLPLGCLSDLLEERGRWDFLFTSAPLNVPGGVGSPANALAIL